MFPAFSSQQHTSIASNLQQFKWLQLLITRHDSLVKPCSYFTDVYDRNKRFQQKQQESSRSQALCFMVLVTRFAARPQLKAYLTSSQEVGLVLKIISTSCDLPTLRNYLLRKQSRSSDDTRLKTETELWLDNWEKIKKEVLPHDEKANILEVIRHWTRSQLDTAQIKRNASSWSENPSSFCGTAPPETLSSTPGLIGLYFQEYEKIEERPKLDQVRRKIILLNTFIVVQDEERRIRNLNALKPNTKKRKRIDSLEKRTESHRSSAINAIAQRIWGRQNLSEREYQRRRRKLTRMSRYGEKWSSINPRALILGIGEHSRR